MATCNVCCETFNFKNRSITVCPQEQCQFSCCKQCMKTYILQGLSEAHCMSCKFKYDEEYLIKTINLSFYKKDYKEKKMNSLYELEKSLIPSTQEDAKKKLLCDEEDKKILKCKEYIKNVTHSMKIEIREYEENKQKIMGTYIEVAKGPAFKCSVSGCKGHVLNYKCVICDTTICDKCLVINEDEHKCKEDDIKSAELILKDTKPCPSCKTRIYKIDGCDQMWCTECRTAFSWKTSVIELKHIHNPHYNEYLRKNGLERRAEGDVRCGGIPELMQHWKSYETQVEMINKLDKTQKPSKDVLRKYKSYTENIKYNILKYVMITDSLNHKLTWFRTRPVFNEARKKLRILYILGKVDETTWKKKIYELNSKEEKLTEIIHSLELIFNVGLDMLIDFRYKIEECLPQSQKELLDEFKEIENGKLSKLYIESKKLEKEYDTMIHYMNDLSIHKINRFKTSRYLIKYVNRVIDIREYNVKSLSKFYKP